MNRLFQNGDRVRLKKTTKIRLKSGLQGYIKANTKGTIIKIDDVSAHELGWLSGIRSEIPTVRVLWDSRPTEPTYMLTGSVEPLTVIDLMVDE